MSWSMMVEPTDAADFPTALNNARLVHGSGNQTDEEQQQITVAKAAALAIFQSGALGPTGTPGILWGANLGGHANEGHKPKPGWSNDSMNVGVYSIIKPDEQPEPAPSLAAAEELPKRKSKAADAEPERVPDDLVSA